MLSALPAAALLCSGLLAAGGFAAGRTVACAAPSLTFLTSWQRVCLGESSSLSCGGCWGLLASRILPERSTLAGVWGAATVLHTFIHLAQID